MRDSITGIIALLGNRELSRAPPPPATSDPRDALPPHCHLCRHRRSLREQYHGFADSCRARWIRALQHDPSRRRHRGLSHPRRRAADPDHERPGLSGGGGLCRRPRRGRPGSGRRFRAAGHGTAQRFGRRDPAGRARRFPGQRGAADPRRAASGPDPAGSVPHAPGQFPVFGPRRADRHRCLAGGRGRRHQPCDARTAAGRCRRAGDGTRRHACGHHGRPQLHPGGLGHGQLRLGADDPRRRVSGQRADAVVLERAGHGPAQPYRLGDGRRRDLCGHRRVAKLVPDDDAADLCGRVAARRSHRGRAHDPLCRRHRAGDGADGRPRLCLRRRRRRRDQRLYRHARRQAAASGDAGRYRRPDAGGCLGDLGHGDRRQDRGLRLVPDRARHHPVRLRAGRDRPDPGGRRGRAGRHRRQRHDAGQRRHDRDAGRRRRRHPDLGQQPGQHDGRCRRRRLRRDRGQRPHHHHRFRAGGGSAGPVTAGHDPQHQPAGVPPAGLRHQDILRKLGDFPHDERQHHAASQRLRQFAVPDQPLRRAEHANRRAWHRPQRHAERRAQRLAGLRLSRQRPAAGRRGQRHAERRRRPRHAARRCRQGHAVRSDRQRPASWRRRRRQALWRGGR
ncbi:hypothetical protein PAAM106076_17670 [Paracoccus aminovorans]